MRKHYKFIVGIVIGLILSGIVGYAATTISSVNISYNNSNSGLKSSTLQGAIDELYEKTKPCEVTSGTGKKVGDVITCGTESFYVISYSQSSTAMLTKYKLDVGYDFDTENGNSTQRFYSSNTQLASCNDSEWNCVILYSSNGSTAVIPTATEVTKVIGNYQNHIRNRKGLETSTVSILNTSQLESLGCSVTYSWMNSNSGTKYLLDGDCSSTGYSWLYDTITIIEKKGEVAYVPAVLRKDGSIENTTSPFTGIRPVVTINSNQIKY